MDLKIPSEWSVPAKAATDSTAAEQWWRSFGDSTLGRVVDEALRNNYNIKAAAARVRAAAALARISGADMLPNASLSLQASRRRQNLIGIPIPFKGDIITTWSNSMGVSLDLSWEIDLWGRIRSGKSAALADLEAGWADLEATRLSIAGQTMKACFALIEAGMQLDLAEETVENYRLSAEQVQSRYRRGLRTALDLHLALANLASAQSLLEARKIQLDQAKRQLEILLGRYPGARITAGKRLPSIDRPVPAGLPSELLIRRPDLIAAERRYAAARRRVSAARRAFFPQVRLTSSGGTLSNQLKDLANGDLSVWNVAAGVFQPVFQGGRLMGNLSQSKALADQALAGYAQTLLNAFGEVESALYAEHTLAAREAAAKKAAEESEAAKNLAEEQYRQGLVDYITVLEAQRRALSAESDFISIRRARLDARVNLHLALGGGFQLEKKWNGFLELIEKRETEEGVEKK
jgi:NodT family efflux transporter outer membrane factor (OMF) lipoprotein